MSQKIGFAAENYARNYLMQQGLSWVTSNYRCRVGEIDLIMRDREYFVFVEVRARRMDGYGSAVESINFSKRQKLIRTASFYLMKHRLYEKYPSRFDVLSLQGVPPQIDWIKNAFE